MALLHVATRSERPTLSFDHSDSQVRAKNGVTQRKQTEFNTALRERLLNPDEMEVNEEFLTRIDIGEMEPEFPPNE